MANEIVGDSSVLRLRSTTAEWVRTKEGGKGPLPPQEEFLDETEVLTLGLLSIRSLQRTLCDDL
jgi:hypothetical protein